MLFLNVVKTAEEDTSDKTVTKEVLCWLVASAWHRQRALPRAHLCGSVVIMCSLYDPWPLNWTPV